jgi:hypothetical protein
MTKGLMVDAALGLTARQKRISQTNIGIRRGSLTLIPSRATRPAQWPWSGHPDSSCRFDRSRTDGFPDHRKFLTILSNDPAANRILFGANAPMKEKQGPMTIDNLIKGIVSFKIDTIARFQAVVSNDVASRDAAHAVLEGSECDKDHYW